jgi:hypothetical protein
MGAIVYYFFLLNEDKEATVAIGDLPLSAAPTRTNDDEPPKNRAEQPLHMSKVERE